MLEELGMTVVGIATTAQEAQAAVRTQEPELVLLDIGLPDQSGILVGEAIVRERPETKVVALTAMEDPHVLREALRVGFSGYLTKATEAEKFGRALHSVLDGQVVVPRHLRGGAFGANQEGHSETSLMVQQLTSRELEVLSLLAEGATSQQIAARLHVSPNTVRTHVQGILSKLQVHSRLEAVAFAVRHGVVRVRS